MAARWLGLVVLFGCTGGTVAAQQPGASAPEPPKLKLESPAFSDGSLLPKAFTCSAEGGNAVSPPLQWSHSPKETVSFVVIMSGMDNHPAKGMHEETFWIRWNIPATTTQLAQGVPLGAELPDGSRQFKGGRGIVGYRPPCPPPGVGIHHYMFKLYALDQRLNLPAEPTRADVMNAMDGHVVRPSTYMGVFER